MFRMCCSALWLCAVLRVLMEGPESRDRVGPGGSRSEPHIRASSEPSCLACVRALHVFGSCFVCVAIRPSGHEPEHRAEGQGAWAGGPQSHTTGHCLHEHTVGRCLTHSSPPPSFISLVGLLRSHNLTFTITITLTEGAELCVPVAECPVCV